MSKMKTAQQSHLTLPPTPTEKRGLKLRKSGSREGWGEGVSEGVAESSVGGHRTDPLTRQRTPPRA